MTHIGYWSREVMREEELLSHWWKEYAECSEGPVGPSKALNTTTSSLNDELYVVEEERVGVPVKGGLYEVDLTKRHCFPVYWHGENRRVLRGHWFARKGGLDCEDVAEQLELAYRCQIWHRRTFQPSGLFAARVDLQGSVQGLHALFTGEDDTWEAWLVYDSGGFSLNFGRGNGIKLRRGFSPSGSLKPTQDELRQQKEEEMDDYCSQVPVGHLVFMVHGIGQRLEKANLVDDVGDFRRITSSLAERHLTPFQRCTQRVLFIPCQWRKGLKLSSENAVEKITLDGVRGLRVTLSATVHDVLYYMSPMHCQDIIDSVSNQLNRLYTKFLKRNPGYDGKVSIYGHSLGSVLSYDILCHQDNTRSTPLMDSAYMRCWEKDQAKATDQSLSSDSVVMSDKNSIATGDSDPKEPPRARVEESSMPVTQFMVHHGKMEDLCHSVNPISPADVSGDCPEDFTSINPEGGCQLPLNEVESNSSPVLEKINQTYGQQSTTTSHSGESKCNIKSDVSPGSFEANAVTFGCMPEDTSDKDRMITLMEEEVKHLKERIAGLEQKQVSSTSCNEDYDGRNKVMNGDSVAEQASPIKFLPNEDILRKIYTPSIRYTKLSFKVDTFFAAGSPLGVFLALRNIRIGIGRGQSYWERNLTFFILLIL
ncbi:uncharacterized protein A4U43_C04F27840 [Asparagus officinalis]|uniref:DDHD domain-containing protein n=1 Tax=Asparagus officinalis TaxID=4686 RepID=A0A5P1F469_ASPOF|nr:uncharacterized protein A4U43_C04F27840 [Asparagus officinalis]